MSFLSKTWNKIKDYVPAVAGAGLAYLTGGLSSGATVGQALASSGLISAGVGLTSNNLNKDAQLDAEQRQFEYTKELNSEMNAYNTPEAQMERYVKAGMNPYLASVSSGTQGSAGSVSTSSTNPGAGFDRAVAIANAQADLKAKSLANDAKTIENSYLPQQIEATIAETLNKSTLLQNQILTSQIDRDMLNHDLRILNKPENINKIYKRMQNPTSFNIFGMGGASW